MRDLSTCPAEACDPDTNRVQGESCPLMSKALAYIVARLILMVLRHLLEARLRRAARYASQPMEQPNAPQQAAPTPAVPASRTPRRPADTSWRKEFPHLARLLAAVRNAPLEMDDDPSAQPEQTANETIRAAISPDAAACSTAAPAPSPRAVMRTPPPRRQSAPAGATRISLPAAWRKPIARAGPDPPAGTRADCDYHDHPFCIV